MTNEQQQGIKNKWKKQKGKREKDETINNMHIILHLNRIIRKVKMIKLERVDKERNGNNSLKYIKMSIE